MSQAIQTTSAADRTFTSFRPRPSAGWAWLLVMAGVIGAVGVAPALAAGLSSGSVVLTLIITVPVALAFLTLAYWFPTMRYELGREMLTLRYGPVLTYHIRLNEIRTVRRRTLSLTVWSTIRFPGIALFSVPYSDVGSVKMCATAALNDVLLIETDKEKYGITPQDEAGFINALQANMQG